MVSWRDEYEEVLEVVGHPAEKYLLWGWLMIWLVCSLALGTQDYAAEREHHICAASGQR